MNRLHLRVSAGIWSAAMRRWLLRALLVSTCSRRSWPASCSASSRCSADGCRHGAGACARAPRPSPRGTARPRAAAASPAADGVALDRLAASRAAGPGARHGARGARLRRLPRSRDAVRRVPARAGFDVLAPDARGHGESGGLRRPTACARPTTSGAGPPGSATRTPGALPLRASARRWARAHVLLAEARRPTFCADRQRRGVRDLPRRRPGSHRAAARPRRRRPLAGTAGGLCRARLRPRRATA